MPAAQEIRRLRQVLDVVLPTSESGLEPNGSEPKTALTGFPSPRVGELVLVGARKGLGKTTFALMLAHRFSVEHRTPVMLGFYEDGVEDYARRLLAIAEGSAPARDASGAVRKREIERLRDAPVALFRGAARSLEELRAAVQRWRESQPGAALLVVDTIQFLHENAESSTPHSVVANGLKAMATDLGIAIVATSQVADDSGSDFIVPSVSSLVGGAELCSVADTVVTLARATDAFDISGRQSDRASESAYRSIYAEWTRFFQRTSTN